MSWKLWKKCYFDGRDRFISVRKDSFLVHRINDAPFYVLAYILFSKQRCLSWILGIIQEGKELASGKLGTNTKAMPGERRMYSIGDDTFPLRWLFDCIWVRDLTALMHLGLNLRYLCAPYQDHGSPVALPKLQMAPRLIILISSGSKKKSDTCVWVRPRPNIHKECGPRFPLLLHTPYTAGCLATLAGPPLR